jgi:hypothetical protein
MNIMIVPGLKRIMPNPARKEGKMEYPQLKATLYKKINEWIEENCDSDEWGETRVFVGIETGEHMTNAAYAVFLGIVEAQKYGRQEGFFNDNT